MTSQLKTSPVEQGPPLSLTPLLSRRWALSGMQFASVTLLAAIYLLASYVPLPLTGLPGHVALGNSILADHALPAADPFVPLTEGMQYESRVWLSQILFAGVHQTLGLEGLTFFFAGLSLLTGVLVFSLFVRSGAPLAVAMLSTLMFVGLTFIRTLALQPESLGLVCFVLLLHVIQSMRNPDRSASGLTACVGVAVLFAAWVNLHQSFSVGLMVLGLIACVRLIEAGIATRSLVETLRSTRFRSALYLFEFAVVGSLLNPYGIDYVLNSVLPFGGRELLLSADEHGLMMTSAAGLAVGLSVLGTMALLRFSRLPFDRGLTVAWSGLGVVVCLHQNHLTWFVLATMLLWQPHLAALWRQWIPERTDTVDESVPVTAKEFRLSLVALLVIWLAFVFSPASRLLLGGKQRLPERYLHAATPIELGRYLAQHPPRGMILSPEGWSDFLSYVGGSSKQLYLTTIATPYLPRMVRQDFLNMNRGDEHLQSLLDKYRIGSVVVDRTAQPVLEKQLRQLAGWSVAFENDTALLMQRNALNANFKAESNTAVSMTAGNLHGWCEHD